MLSRLTIVLPLAVAATVFVAACGPAAAPSPTTAPAAAAPTQPAAAAAKPTTPPAAVAAPTQAPAATAAGKPVKGGQLTVAMERDPTTFDPVKSQDVYSNAIIGLTCDSLYKIDDKGAVV